VISKTIEVGWKAEESFKATASTLGFKVYRSPGILDTKEHWDLYMKMKIDVKAMKKINRYDKEVQDEWHWLELHSVREGNEGWIYGSKADAIAFETKGPWVIVTVNNLIRFIERYVKDEEVDKASEAKYKIYSRNGIDMVTLVETSELKKIGWLCGSS